MEAEAEAEAASFQKLEAEAEALHAEAEAVTNLPLPHHCLWEIRRFGGIGGEVGEFMTFFKSITQIPQNPRATNNKESYTVGRGD